MIRILSYIWDHLPGFFAISGYGVNWHFVAYLGDNFFGELECGPRTNRL